MAGFEWELYTCVPERIDASPEEIAEVVLKAKPKETWRYEQEAGRAKRPKKDG